MLRFSQKRLVGHIEREHKLSESNLSENLNNNKKIIFPEKQNNVNNPKGSTSENHVYVVIGPGNVGKTYYML